MTFDPAIHHRRTHRLSGYNYAAHGAYFLTLCVQGKEPLLGKIHANSLALNDAGRMVEHWWHELSGKFPTVQSDHYIIMPDHLHGIITLHPATHTAAEADPWGCPWSDSPPSPVNQSGHTNPVNQGGHIGPPLHQVVQWFKTMSTNAYIRGVCNQQWPPFHGRLWQRDYYDRIIRNQTDLDHMRRYIRENPTRWNTNHPNHS